ncbi:hypothetical protein BBO99_00006303 [Phytophthora kernoviae]|uniref:BD-FAE-like domain-containing protein n=2 Tax=Phytophthora kernoviae TaxID=325452 RepID=A0A3R7GX91_9STRA|nr:hypothetical protein G195_009710 [Phytophthora kernoviae 00238/432]KAG2511669.1 hypothetical protein JM16_006163 [Phytophthora kernoviae]KAG2515785.1 hypothetical protein JM18_008120 [Phytophthora kernoviae]RLN77993.1 hypothetical protein BBO99_00006303 [Phytophthora kernoviae]
MTRQHVWLLAAALVVTITAVNANVIHALLESKRLLEEEQDDEDRTVPFASWNNVPDTLSHLLAFVLVLLGAHPLGLLFPKYLRLPLITGYLVAGILAGPFLANLLNEDVVDMLGSYVNAFALSFISFQAGQEIYLPELKPQIKAILKLLTTFYCIAMVLGTTVFMLAAGAFFYSDLDSSCQLGISLMFASISVLVSPSTVMALKIELNTVGPFTHLALGTCMTAEFVVLVSFSVSRVIASIYCAKLDVSPESIIFTMGVVLMNIVLGALLGLVTILIFQIPSGQLDLGPEPPVVPVRSVSSSKTSRYSNSQRQMKISQRTDSKHDLSDLGQTMEDPDQVPHPHNAYIEETDTIQTTNNKQWWTERKALYLKGFIWILMGYTFYLFTNTLSDLTTAHFGLVWQVKFEALLVLMIASCAAGHYAAIRPEMHVILDTMAPYMFLPFFVMTGASLQLDKVVDVLPMMSLYLALRYMAIFLAVYGGGRFLLKLPPRHYKHLWLTMAPQAGVSLGLAAEVKELITDDWGAEFAATIVAAVVVNQVIGPVLCSIGLRGAGESMADRQAAAVMAQAQDKQDKHGGDTDMDIEAGKEVPPKRVFSRHNSVQMLSSARNSGDPRALLPFYRVQSAVVLGDDEVAFEIALELSLYGAHVNVPLLDEARAEKWRRMNETILQRTAKGELISFQNSIQDRRGETPVDSGMQNADVLIFTGTPERSLEHAKVMQTMLGENVRPRLIAVVDDCVAGAELRKLGVLTVQPAIALGNIVTRLALLDAPLAANLSKELSSASNFSAAAYFRSEVDDGRDSLASLSELRLPARRLALGRNVVNHHTVDYDRLAEALAAENLPLPPPPSRVAMFGTSSVEHDPFATRSRNLGAHEHYVAEDDGFCASDDRKRPAIDAAPTEASQPLEKQQPENAVNIEETADLMEPLLMMQLPNGDQATTDEDPEVQEEKHLLPKVGTFSQLDAASTACLGKYIEDEEALHPLESNGSASSLHAPSMLSSNGSVPRPPHSRSLVMDPDSNAAVYQTSVASGAEAVEVVAEQSWLITKLAVQLLWALRMSKRWILCALRLIGFVMLLLLPIVKVAFYWFVNENVHKNIIYGLNRRNLLDVYTVPQSGKDAVTQQKQRSTSTSSATSATSASFTEARYPVVVFVSGGAWIIGYKAWGALMGRVLASLGIVVVMPDYRNFPQGVVPDMVEDVTRAMQWVFDNVHLFGGDRENVHLIGQSAGAHLAMCTLLEQVEKKRTAAAHAASHVSSPTSSLGGMGNTSDCESIESVSPLAQPITWELRQVRSYIGISGPFNMEASIATFHRHGFDRAVVERIMAHRLAYYSPALRVLALSELPSRTRQALLKDFPPCYLFHGTADKTVSYRSSEQFTTALQACNVPVFTRMFESKTHTDPIIEDPIVGDDFLLDDVVAALKARAPVDSLTGKPRYELGARPQEKRYYPKVLVRIARKVNPF